MNIFKTAIIDMLDVNIHEKDIEDAPTGMGDFALPCFIFAKEFRKSPDEIAKEIADSVKSNDLIHGAKANGAYVNFFVDKEKFAEQVFKKKKQLNKKQKVMIEYSQVNTHKAFHVGHLRGTILGGAIVNLHRYSGYKTVAANYQGDIGAHVAKVIWYLNKFTPVYPREHKGRWLGKIYQKANKKITEDDSLKQEVSIVLQGLENNDSKLEKLWKKTRKWSLDDFEEFYKVLGVKFDKYFFESKYEKKGKILVAEMLKSGIAEKSNGAVIINLKKLGNFLLLKSDGTALYSTKDLALAKEKFENFKIDKSIYIVGAEQKLYFQQIFKTLEIMGFSQAKQCYHVPYGLVNLKGGKISSREGELLYAEEFVQEVITEAKTQISQRHKLSTKELNTRAKKIAMSAIKFSFLNQDNNKEIIFDKKTSLSFEGETGPYVQYTCARISSILKKAGSFKKTIKWNINDEEHELIKMLGHFDEIINDATEGFRPHVLCRYLLDLCQAFNSYYHEIPILKAKEEKRGRLSFISFVKEVISEGLVLLGVEPLEEM